MSRFPLQIPEEAKVFGRRRSLEESKAMWLGWYLDFLGMGMPGLLNQMVKVNLLKEKSLKRPKVPHDLAPSLRK